MTLILIIRGLLLLFSGLPVAFVLMSMGIIMLIAKGLPLVMVAQNMVSAVDDFVLLSVPMFLLMSNILLRCGVGNDLFEAVQSWVGHWPGGLGVATLISCGIFSAISGSSVATAATIATVAVPEMTSRGYERSFTLGLLAAGGTLGTLIPPSIPLIIYGVITEESIGQLFLAGIGPGLLLILFFGIFIVAYSIVTGNYQKLAPADWAQRRSATIRALPTVLVAAIIIIGICAAAFTPTEAAAVGFLLSLFVTAVILSTLTLERLIDATTAALRTTVVLFLVIVGAKLFGKAVTLYQIPSMVSSLVDAHVSEQWLFLLIVTGILPVIGLFLESMSMLLIMMPVLLPTVLALGIDPVWFGIYFVIMIEIALITPPVGLNLFVIQAVAKSELGAVVRGVLPYVFVMLFSVWVIYVLPQIALFIPQTLY